MMLRPDVIEMADWALETNYLPTSYLPFAFSLCDRPNKKNQILTDDTFCPVSGAAVFGQMTSSMYVIVYGVKLFLQCKASALLHFLTLVCFDFVLLNEENAPCLEMLVCARTRKLLQKSSGCVLPRELLHLYLYLYRTML